MLHQTRSKVRFAPACPWFVARSILAVSIAALASASCGGLVEVGAAKDDQTSAPPNDGLGDGGDDDGGPDPIPTAEPGPPAVPAPLDCTLADKQAREPYEAWTRVPNDFGPLLGKTFDGYVEGGPDLSLVIDDTGNATLFVGEPAPLPAAAQGYLCGDELQDGRQCGLRYLTPPVEGGVYPLRGATFAAGRLSVPIQSNSPYDAWCALQTPRETEGCFFTAFGTGGFSVTPGTGMCTYDGQPVDCGWLELVQYSVCRCTSTDCYADIYPETATQIDARFDAAKRELSGTFLDGDRAQHTIHLFEVVE